MNVFETHVSLLEINQNLKKTIKKWITSQESTRFAWVLFTFLACCQLPALSAVEAKPEPPKTNPVIQDLSGRALIDRTLEVTGAIQGDKWLELIESSTPTTPTANHVRIWLRADGTKSSIVATFDDGTSVRIAGN